jgi:metal-responsive CopG/Arc/MetJ family transcriptional regulator
MAIVKTAISIQESLFERADALAQQLHLSRSQLFARALDEYLKKHESRKLLETINSALESEPDPGEAERLMRQKQRRRVEGQW